jgi:hypothetical protein
LTYTEISSCVTESFLNALSDRQTVSQSVTHTRTYIWRNMALTSLLCIKVESQSLETRYRICVCISCTFLTRIYPPKLGCGLYTELKKKKNLDPPRKSCYHTDDSAHDAGIACCETPSRDC